MSMPERFTDEMLPSDVIRRARWEERIEQQVAGLTTRFLEVQQSQNNLYNDFKGFQGAITGKFESIQAQVNSQFKEVEKQFDASLASIQKEIGEHREKLVRIFTVVSVIQVIVWPVILWLLTQRWIGK